MTNDEPFAQTFVQPGAHVPNVADFYDQLIGLLYVAWWFVLTLVADYAFMRELGYLHDLSIPLSHPIFSYLSVTVLFCDSFNLLVVNTVYHLHRTTSCQHEHRRFGWHANCVVVNCHKFSLHVQLPKYINRCKWLRWCIQSVSVSQVGWTLQWGSKQIYTFCNSILCHLSGFLLSWHCKRPVFLIRKLLPSLFSFTGLFPT